MAAANDQQLLQKVHNLSDLELAALLSLISREHCLVSTSPEAVDELTEELRLIATRTFGLAPVIISCHAHTTLDDFAARLLLAPPPQTTSPTANSNSSNNNGRSISPYRTRHLSPQHHDPSTTSPTGPYFLPHRGGSQRSNGGPMTLSSSTTAAASSAQQAPPPPQIANVVIAKHLDCAPLAVQIQALELLRTRRIFTRTSVHTAPKHFLFIAAISADSGGQAHVTPHLNDFFYLAHWHDPEEGFAYLDEEYDGSDIDDDNDAASTDSSLSVVKRSGSALSSSFTAADGRSIHPPKPAPGPTEGKPPPPPPPVFTDSEVAILAQLTQQVQVDVEVTRYQTNIVSFLRMHRAVGGGITPTATKHFEQLMKSLAPLHGLDYVTPSLVGLAAKKVYLHRIAVVRPERERSMQWGSELAAVEAILDGVGPEDVIEDVLGMVAAPP
ncbi:hypothetical protein B0T25DRAFT_534334 [Lasiosphaeria hispida]|uniref:magnesium chelatase n=1 Tax=Lasiosphaeria hispida TaxID=260671 RepID=A0AAJ0HR72_9PEZI|nr:hypothetical protein B0T25DRAFT_534334 [Lasiosphaeria hispida]